MVPKISKPFYAAICNSTIVISCFVSSWYLISQKIYPKCCVPPLDLIATYIAYTMQPYFIVVYHSARFVKYFARGFLSMKKLFHPGRYDESLHGWKYAKLSAPCLRPPPSDPIHLGMISPELAGEPTPAPNPLPIPEGLLPYSWAWTQAISIYPPQTPDICAKDSWASAARLWWLF